MIAAPLVIATHNPGKLREIGDLLAPLGIPVTSAGALALAEPEETGASFEENALLKARVAAEGSGYWALADDSGLEVAALGGAPGIYSARWAGGSKDFSFAMRRVEEELHRRGIAPEGAEARFVCVLALSSPGGVTQCFTGTVEGTLTFPPRGAQGFGYDPIFLPRGGRETFGEMEPEEKHRISHRAMAFRLFLDYLREAA